MSYKQCRSIKQCNREFMCVLNSSMDAVQKTLAEEEIERTERFKADRKKRFYEEYANDQLTRIITSLMV